MRIWTLLLLMLSLALLGCEPQREPPPEPETPAITEPEKAPEPEEPTELQAEPTAETQSEAARSSEP